MSKKAIVAKLDVLYTKLPNGTEEDHKRPEGMISGRGFEPSTTRLQVKSVRPQVNMSKVFHSFT
jgi:hypothetical protein